MPVSRPPPRGARRLELSAPAVDHHEIGTGGKASGSGRPSPRDACAGSSAMDESALILRSRRRRRLRRTRAPPPPLMQERPLGRVSKHGGLPPSLRDARLSGLLRMRKRLHPLRQPPPPFFASRETCAQHLSIMP